jgi:hypothetical protein
MGAAIRSANIGAFVEAQRTEKVVKISGYHSAMEGSVIPDFPPPVVQVRVSDHQKNEGAIRGLNLEPVPGVPGVFQGSPTWSEFQTLMRMGISETRFAPGKVSMNAYVAFWYLIRLVTTYSFVTKPTTAGGTTLMYWGNEVGKLDGSTNKVNFSATKAVFDTMQTVDIRGCHSYLSGYAVPVATPLSKKNTLEYLSFKSWSMTNGDTWTFKYFRDMYIPDGKFVPNLVQRLFYRSLGSNAKSCANAMEYIKNGFRTLSHTSQGEALSHMFLGIAIAENAAAGFYPVFSSGRYGGFIIQNAGQILLRGTELAVGTLVEANKFISMVNIHDQRLAEVVAIIEGVINADGTKKYPCKVSDIDTSRKLQDYFGLLDLGDFATNIDDLVSKIDDLEFSDRYAEPSIKNISLAVDFMISGNKDLLVPFHRYLRGGAIKRRNNVAVALSIFGPRCPSINYGITFKNKITFTIPKEADKQDLNLASQKDGKPAIQYIPVSIVNFDVAVNQWSKLLSSGKLVIASPRPNKKEFTDKSVVASEIGGRDLETFYKLMKKAIILHAAKDPNTGKRKGAGEEGEGVRVKKAKKDFADAMADVQLFE